MTSPTTDPTIGTVYLIHLDNKLGNTQHYIGWAKFVRHRLAHHRGGSGSKYLRAASQVGITFDVVREWKDKDRNFERKLKNRKNAKFICPICNPGCDTHPVKTKTK